MYKTLYFSLLMILGSMQVWGQEVVGDKNYDECNPAPYLIILRGLEAQLSDLTGNDETRDYAINQFLESDQKWYRAYNCEVLADSITALQARIEDNSGGVPTVTTSGFVDSEEGMYLFAGEVTDTGGGTMSAAGISISPDATFTSSIDLPYDVLDAGSSLTGAFQTDWQDYSDDLGMGYFDTFYWRAYATNEYGTGYGDIYYSTPGDIYSNWNVNPNGTLYVEP